MKIDKAKIFNLSFVPHSFILYNIMVAWGEPSKLFFGQGSEFGSKCDQCDYARADPSALSQHLKRHSGERPFNCNQCNYASSQAVHLTTHLIKHCRDNPNKCNQCKFACSQPSVLRTHVWIHMVEISQINAISVIMHHLVQVAWWHIWKSTT